MSIRIAIVEDEKAAIESISYMIQYVPEAEIVCTASSVREAICLLEEEKPDLVLLDIKMQDGTGFDVLSRLSQVPFKVIFITAYHEYAIKAFEFNAIDYLLKPIELDRFKKAINRVGDKTSLKYQDIQLQHLSTGLSENINSYDKLILKTIDGIHLIELQEILRCESDRNYTIFYFTEKKSLVISKTLSTYEKLLSEKGFFRIHQSHLINLKHLKIYDKRNGGTVIMSDGMQLPLANRKKEELMSLLQKFNS